MTTNPIVLIRSMLDRAERLTAELEQVYQRDLNAKEVSAEALNLTHEIIEKCSNILDQIMESAFRHEISPKIQTQPKRGGYFPAAHNEQSYRSTLGQWNATNLDEIDPILDRKLRFLQPFSDPSNVVFARIKEIASKKHTALQPQVRREQHRVNVARLGHGSVSWGPGVTFGNGVSVMGVPINPLTQLPAHTQGIDVSVETWVSFHLVDGGEDALALCKAAVLASTRALKTILG